MLKRKARNLSMAAVVKEMARHNPDFVKVPGDVRDRVVCSVCWTENGRAVWPCETVQNLQAAEEAISEALEYFGPAPEGIL